MEEGNVNIEFKNIQVYTEKLVTNMRDQGIEILMVKHARDLRNVYTYH